MVSKWWYDLLAAHDIYQIIRQIRGLFFTEACCYRWDKMFPVASWPLRQSRVSTYVHCLFL